MHGRSRDNLIVAAIFLVLSGSLFIRSAALHFFSLKGFTVERSPRHVPLRYAPSPANALELSFLSSRSNCRDVAGIRPRQQSSGFTRVSLRNELRAEGVAPRVDFISSQLASILEFYTQLCSAQLDATLDIMRDDVGVTVAHRCRDQVATSATATVSCCCPTALRIRLTHPPQITLNKTICSRSPHCR